MNDKQQETIRELRHAGFAVIVWTPEELDGVDPRDVEDTSIEAGHEAINALKEYADGEFIQELEKRSMSTWTDEELKRYSQLTGQEEESECNCGADQVADQASHFAWCASLQDEGQEP